MNKYQLVSDRKVEEPSKDNEIRITKNGIIGKYISYAFRLIQDENKSLVIKAMGQTIHRAIIVAEILKRRIVGLHQINELGSVKVVDIYEPIEEGLDKVELTRQIPSITITLSTQELDIHHSGYQSPLSAELFAENNAIRARGRPRGNRRGPVRSQNRRDEQTESKETGNRQQGGSRVRDNRPRGPRNGSRNESRPVGGYRDNQNRQGQNYDGQNRDNQNRDNQNRGGQNRDNQNRQGQNRDNQNREGQTRDNQNRVGGYRGNQNRDGQNRDNQNRDNQNRDNQNRGGQTRDNQNRGTQNRERQNSGRGGARPDGNNNYNNNRQRKNSRPTQSYTPTKTPTVPTGVSAL